MFRGREIEHPKLGMVLLKAVADYLVDDAMMEMPPRFESGRMLSMVLAPVFNDPPKPEKTDSEESEKVLDRA